jgi:asparagine synthase (glutamine-hydrolysing)
VEKFNLTPISPNSVIDILTLRYNTEIKSGISKLSWNDFTSTKFETSIEFIKKSIKKTLQNSIDTDCKKISIALSGGIDSTLTLALLRETFPNLQISAISLKFADSIDETPQAAKIAENFDAEHEIINLNNFFIELPKAISITKQPFWDLHWYHIAKQAKSHSDYLVSGDGGDELFGGYTFRYQKFLSLVNQTSSPTERVKCYLKCHERDWVEDQTELFGEKIDFSWKKIHSNLIQYFDNPLSLIQQIFLADYNGKLLYNFNPVNSTLDEYFGIKPITPLLSEDMITYASHLATDLKYDEKTNVGKIPLRKLLENYIDDDLLTQTKQGFSVNTVNLWKSSGHKLCKTYLDDARIVKDGWISQSWIENHLKSQLDVKHVNKFLGLLSFEIWYRIFVTSEMDSNTLLDI